MVIQPRPPGATDLPRQLARPGADAALVLGVGHLVGVDAEGRQRPAAHQLDLPNIS